MLTDTIKQRLAKFLADSLKAVTSRADQLGSVAWLAVVREILADDSLSSRDKFHRIRSTIDLRQTGRAAGHSVVTTLRNYRDSRLPLSLKLALPATLIALPVVGGTGAGVAMLGGAVGMPALLLVFLGTAGITSVIEAMIGSREGRSYAGVVLALIAQDEVLRRTRQSLREAMADRPATPKRFDMPADRAALHARLVAMDPFDFERHVMSFFQQQGWLAWTTPRSNDAGVDGFVRHPEGLILVQCKRNALSNPVGRPIVQQFKGAVEENQAWRGYIVTTSSFTNHAVESAALSEKLHLIDADQLLDWHDTLPRFE